MNDLKDNLKPKQILNLEYLPEEMSTLSEQNIYIELGSLTGTSPVSINTTNLCTGRSSTVTGERRSPLAFKLVDANSTFTLRTKPSLSKKTS